jgi:hypothetical protein
MNFSKSLVIICMLFGSIVSIGSGQTNNGVAAADPPLTIGGGWHQFNWNVSISPTNTDGAFTFTAASPVQLDVTDAYIDGDRFEVLDFGVSLGLTSVPADDGAWTNAPDAAFADPRWSSGTFLLGAGEHSIELVTIQTATGTSEGVGYLQVVPEPSTWALVAGTLGGLLTVRKKTKKDGNARPRRGRFP